jgi:membrane protein
VSGVGEIAHAGRALRADLRIVTQQFARQDIFFHAGAVAYSALLAGVPFLLLLASAAGYILEALPVSTNFLRDFLGQILPDATAEAALPIANGIIEDVEDRRNALGLLGAPLFALFATRFFGSLRASLASVFDVARGHGFFRGKLYDLGYVAAGTICVTLYIALHGYLALGTTVGRAALDVTGLDPDFLGFAEFLAGRLLATSFLAFMFTLLYKFLPNRHVGWESAAWGGVWGSMLFELARSVIFEVATRVVSPASLYSGTLAAIVVVVFWAYYAAVVFLIGGVVARVHEVRRRRLSGAAEAAPEG